MYRFFISLEYIPMSGSAGSYGDSTWNHLRNSEFFPKWLCRFIFLSAGSEGSVQNTLISTNLVNPHSNPRDRPPFLYLPDEDAEGQREDATSQKTPAVRVGLQPWHCPFSSKKSDFGANSVGSRALRGDG